MKPFVVLSLLIAVVLGASLQLAGAQEATPDVDLATPQASECTVDPRTADDIETLMSTTGEATVEVDLNESNPDAATPTPFVAPEGTPVTEGETATAITDVVTQLYACQNANDTLRMFALMTDDFVVRTIEMGNIDPAAIANAGTPSTGTVASEQRTIDIHSIVEIEADVYGVNVIGIHGSSGEEFTDYLIVVREGDSYLIDDLQNLG